MLRTSRALLILAALIWPARPALPQVTGAAMPCHEHAEIARQLGQGYDEAPVSLGVQSNGNLVEIFSSPRTGTWTMVATAPTGRACVVAAGEGWQTLGAAGPQLAL